jgi:guanylate kinase
MNEEHVLLLIIGRTASGKDSLVNKLCERTGLQAVISYTTRPRRENEGDTHIFTTKAAYEQRKADGNIAAYTEIAGNLYWTTVDQLYMNDIYIIDYDGMKTLKALNLPNLRLVSIYINVPDKIREERALNYRKDNKEVFRIRDFSETRQFREMLKNADFDYAVSNIEFAKAYSTLRWIAQVEGVWQNNKEDTTE